MKRFIAWLAAVRRGRSRNVLPPDLQAVADRFFDGTSHSLGGPPTFTVLYGCVASGKTTYRRQQFASGHVALDAAELFFALGYGADDRFPPVDPTTLNLVGRAIAERAIHERRNLVIELVSNFPAQLDEILAAGRRHGYTASVVFLDCTLEEAIKRNADRAYNEISAFHAQSLHISWLLQNHV